MNKMKDSRKKKLAGKMGVVWMLVIHVRGEKAKMMNAFLFFSKRKVSPMRKIQKVFISLIVVREGHIFNRNEIMNG